MAYQCDDLNNPENVHMVYFRIGEIEVDISTSTDSSLSDVIMHATNAIKLLQEMSNDAEADSGGAPPIKEDDHLAGAHAEPEVERVHLMQRYIR